MLLSGFSPLMAEITKNLVLLGFQHLTWHINAQLTSEESKKILELESLNQLVTINILYNNLPDSSFSNFDLVIFSNKCQATITKYNKLCRSTNRKTGFINCELWGGFFYTFFDFQLFNCTDIDGKPLVKGYISSITQDCPGTVYLSEPQKEFKDLDYVKFVEVEGMIELNELGPIKIRKITNSSFQICDTKLFGAYKKNGYIETVKTQQVFEYDEWEETFQRPKGRFGNFIDLNSESKVSELHFFHRVLRKFVDQTGSLPEILDFEQAQLVKKIAREMNNRDREEGFEFLKDYSEEKLEIVALYAKVQLPAYATYWAGIISLNILKYFGKYKPIYQWAYTENLDIFKTHLEKERINPKNLNISDLIPPKLNNSTIFIVGAGYIGCEILKILLNSGNFSTPNIIVTDKKKVEKANLGQQHLYSQKNIGQFKCEVLNDIYSNTEFKHKVQFISLNLDKKNSAVFSDEFWNRVDFVVDAMGNSSGKNYLYEQLLWYEKPGVLQYAEKLRLEIATCWPNVSQLPESFVFYEDTIDLKNFRNFPNDYDKCVLWSTFEFQIYFCDLLDFTALINNPENFLENKPILELNHIRNLLCLAEKRNYDLCVNIAVSVLLQNFYFNPLELLKNFPPDHTDTYGIPFWSSNRRIPRPIIPNLQDPVQRNFILFFAEILASCFNIPINDLYIFEISTLINFEILIREKESNDNLRLKTREKMVKEEIIKLLAGFKVNSIKKIQLDLISESNKHAEFIYSCSILRANEFKIASLSMIETIILALRLKKIIAPVSGIVAGLICIEVYKYFSSPQNNKPSNFSIDSAINEYLQWESPSPKKTQDKDFDQIIMCPTKAYPAGFTVWDKLVVQGPHSINSFIAFLSTHHNLEVNSFFSDSFILFSKYNKKTNSESYNSRAIESIYQEKGGVIQGISSLKILVVCEPIENEIEYEVAPIKYIFK